MKKQPGKFQTHIPEPRWQQIASAIIFGAILIAQVIFILKGLRVL